MSERKRCDTCKHKSLRLTQKPCNCCGPFHDNWEPAFEPIIETPVMTKNEPPTITDDKNISMIKSIIDEAMEKRDRTVLVYIHGDTMSVSVTPIGADEPRWIPKDGGYVCSTCGQWDHHPTRYCRLCGEALKIVSEEKVEEKTKGINREKYCINCRYGDDDYPICNNCSNHDEFVPRSNAHDH